MLRALRFDKPDAVFHLAAQAIMEGDVFADLRLAFFAVGDRPVLAKAAQRLVNVAVTTARLAEALSVLGEALDPHRWYWAVLATYFVFLGTASSGETLARAWSRIVGTAIGAAAGVLAGLLVHGDTGVAVALLFACLFLSVYLLRASHAMMIFFITASLALLYIVLGRFSQETSIRGTLIRSSRRVEIFARAMKYAPVTTLDELRAAWDNGLRSGGGAVIPDQPRGDDMDRNQFDAWFAENYAKYRVAPTFDEIKGIQGDMATQLAKIDAGEKLEDQAMADLKARIDKLHTI